MVVPGYLLVLWPPIFVALAMLWSLAWESRRPGLRAAAVVALSALCVFGLRMATTRGAFVNGPMERRYVEASRLLAMHTEPDAVILSHQHNATARYYGGRMTLRFEWIPHDWLERAVAWLESKGRHPYALIEEDERPLFREHFATQGATGALDRKLVFTSSSGGPRVYLYDLAATRWGHPGADPRAGSFRSLRTPHSRTRRPTDTIGTAAQVIRGTQVRSTPSTGGRTCIHDCFL